MTTTTREKFANLRDMLTTCLIERDEEISALLLGLVAQEHVLFVGPPGTAKSLLCNSLTAAIDGASAFTRLLTKFSTPEELFGPLSLSALRADRHERKTAGYLPTAHVAFVDEIWKASSAILNSLLTMMEERAHDNGTTREKCPLRLMICASNEWPGADGSQELGAIFDRCVIRRTVRTVSAANRRRLLFADLPKAAPVLTLADVDAAASEAAALPFSQAAQDALLQIVEELAAAGIRPGDRRCRKATKIARAAAWLEGAAEVLPHHLDCLADVLWEDPVEQPQKASEIITRIANPVGARLTEILRDADAIVRDLATDAASQAAAVKKLEASEKEVKQIVKQGNGNGRAKNTLDYLRRERCRINARLLGIPEEKALAMLG